MTGADPILEVRGLNTTFHARRGGKKVQVRAVNNVSFTLNRGDVLGIVGETGCGKTTVGRSILRMATPDSGEAIFNGQNIFEVKGRDLRRLRLKIRMIFQDPFASLDPRRSIGDSIAETGDIHGLFTSRKERQRLIGETLDNVRLPTSFADRFPHELSGGQRQRVGIGRTLLPAPDLVIADEPVSALDVSVQAQVLNLLADLRQDMGLSMLFISHDLGVVGQISDRVAVMYLGHLIEIADTREIFATPRHPYTVALMNAVPRPDPSLRIKGGIELGEPPSRFEEVTGCPYVSRCPKANDRCRGEKPLLRRVSEKASVACHHVED